MLTELNQMINTKLTQVMLGNICMLFVSCTTFARVQYLLNCSREKPKRHRENS